MEGDNCSFPPDLSDDHSQRGSVASSATLSRAQDVLVYLFGESAVHLSVEGLGSVSVQELGHSVREALHIPESTQDPFAFWLCSPLLELQLKPRHQPYKLCRQWQDLLYRFTEASEDDISQGGNLSRVSTKVPIGTMLMGWAWLTPSLHVLRLDAVFFLRASTSQVKYAS
ncbi:FERM domain-containing protein 8 [Xenoophorus captivus]|uniref:FERM domain-containing protein 8 n=1 Tax=Xenoophorus captivus TaxID=1517983 RepID=A0ABV0QW86_9TELE